MVAVRGRKLRMLELLVRRRQRKITFIMVSLRSTSFGNYTPSYTAASQI
jgi:hypothetical protein